MAAKAGITDLIRAAKAAAKAAKPAQGGVAGAAKMPKKAAPAKPTPSGRFGPNVNVLPGNGPKRGPMGRMGKYMDETGRPAMINARPLAKKAVPAKPMGPMPAKKAVPGKKAVAALDARKAAYEKMVKKPVPVKNPIPVKKTQPYVSKPAAPAFKEPGGRTNRPTMGLKKYPPTKKPR